MRGLFVEGEGKLWLFVCGQLAASSNRAILCPQSHQHQTMTSPSTAPSSSPPTETETETPSSSTATTKTITLLHSNNEFPITISKYGLAEWKLKKELKIAVHVSIYLRIDGLREVTKDSQESPLIPLVQNQYATSLRMLMPEQVTHGHKYEIIVTDLRQDAIKQISPEERQEIEQKFNRIDVDHDGHITIDEIRNFYESMIQSKKKNLLEKSKLIIDKKPSDKDRIEKMYQVASQSLDNLVEISIKTFMKLDVDSSATIELNEFLAHEAKILVARKMKAAKDLIDV